MNLVRLACLCLLLPTSLVSLAAAPIYETRRVDDKGNISQFVPSEFINSHNEFNIEALDREKDNVPFVALGVFSKVPANELQTRINTHFLLLPEDARKLDISIDTCKVDNKDDDNVVGFGVADAEGNLALKYAWSLDSEGHLVPLFKPGTPPDKNRISCRKAT